MQAAGASSLKDLRDAADEVLKLTAQPEWTRFETIADGYHVPATNLIEYVHSGEQAHVPLIER